MRTSLSAWQRLACSAIAVFSLSAAHPVFAQTEYPSRAITLIVPFAAGGPTDIVANIVGRDMSEILGQPILVEHVVGSGGTMAAVRAKRAAADGYTILMGHMGTHAAAVVLNAGLPYDPIADFQPIGLVASMPVVVLASLDAPAKTLVDFVDFARRHPNDIVMGHAGIGSVSYSTCLLLNSAIGIEPQKMAFQGTGPAMKALVARKFDYMCDQSPSVVPQLHAGTIRAYAVASDARNPAFPDVPTTAEAGMPHFKVMAWNALFAPKDTPRFVVDALNAALDAALESPDVRQKLLDLGAVIPLKRDRSPGALSALVAAEIARWKTNLKTASSTH